MRKLKIIEHISLDGVIQLSSSAEQDFHYGDWTAPYRSPAGLEQVLELYGQTYDLLLGRQTYDSFASFWPKAPRSPMGDRLNAAKKLVVTHRTEDLPWGPAEAIGPDIAEDVRRMKARSGPDLVLAGSGSLIAALLEHGLADEVVLLVNPVVLGKGRRFFENGGLPRSFALGSSRAMPSGILVNIYKLIPTLAEEALSRAKLQREIEIAREVQERLFPQTLPVIEGVRMAAHCLPAQTIGGDTYDLMALPGSAGAEGNPGCHRLGIAVGDVSGKGISAALLMASLHASLRGQTLSDDTDLGSKVAKINRLLYEASSANRYATLFYAELHAQSRTLHYVNAGHNAPMVLRREEEVWRVFRLDEGGPVVGLLPGASYTQAAFQMFPGDTLLAFTDGLSEAMNAKEQEWGEERILEEARQNAHLGAEELLKHLFHAANAFVGGAPQHDDMTLVVLQLVS